MIRPVRGARKTPWVEAPTSSVDGAFDPQRSLWQTRSATLSCKAASRGGSFAANVRAWRENQEALATALIERVSVSQAETNAFLNAQLKVMAFIQQFMDASYWYLDRPCPRTRANVDGVLTNRFGPLAGE
jgi:hypothetical protein